MADMVEDRGKWRAMVSALATRGKVEMVASS